MHIKKFRYNKDIVDTSDQTCVRDNHESVRKTRMCSITFESIVLSELDCIPKYADFATRAHSLIFSQYFFFPDPLSTLIRLCFFMCVVSAYLSWKRCFHNGLWGRQLYRFLLTHLVSYVEHVRWVWNSSCESITDSFVGFLRGIGMCLGCIGFQMLSLCISVIVSMSISNFYSINRYDMKIANVSICLLKVAFLSFFFMVSIHAPFCKWYLFNVSHVLKLNFKRIFCYFFKYVCISIDRGNLFCFYSFLFEIGLRLCYLLNNKKIYR